MFQEIYAYRALVRNLVLKDLKLKYRDSVLGFLWSLLNPLLMLGVYTLAFEYVLKVQTEDYSYFLLVALLPWTFFASSAQASTGSIVGNAGLIHKVYFPRETLPIATVLFCFAQFLLALGVLLPILILVHRRPLAWTVLLLPALLLLHLLFTVGVALVLSSITARYRDVAHLTEVALALSFWLTPVVYPLSLAPPLLRSLLMTSPLTSFTMAYRDLLFWGRLPETVTLAGIVAFPALALVVGLGVFRRRSPSFPEDL